MIRIGDTVKCIVPEANKAGGGRNAVWMDGEGLMKGACYTVSDIFVDDHGDTMFRLRGVERGATAKSIWGEYIGYSAARFEPA
jgi:hypothetical protein